MQWLWFKYPINMVWSLLNLLEDLNAFDQININLTNLTFFQPSLLLFCQIARFNLCQQYFHFSLGYNQHFNLHELFMQIKYSSSEYTHICMQFWVRLSFCFKQGQLCREPAAASCCRLHQSVLLRTKLNIGGPVAGTLVVAAAVKQKVLLTSINLVTTACRVKAVAHECVTTVISTLSGNAVLAQADLQSIHL